MEILRNQGLEELCIRQEVPRSAHVNKLWMTSLAGVELARIYSWGQGPVRRADYEAVSASSNRFIEQEVLEPVLLGEAQRHGAQVRFGTELLSFSQDAEGVTAHVKDLTLGEEFEIRASYMIGADGARSAVAESLGLPMLGEAGIGTAVNVRFRADLSRYVAYRPASLYSVYLPAFDTFGGSGTLRLVRPFDRWIAIFPEMARDVERVQLESKTAVEIVRRMIGDETIDIELEGISRWLINHMVAQYYSHGRVFCAGDAVHRHPPMNGLGANTCIQDAYNLSWKMAYVLQARAGAALLDTYSDERQPAGKITVDRANKSFAADKKLSAVMGVRPGQSADEYRHARDALLAVTPEGEALRARFGAAIAEKHYTYNALGVEMNTVYASGAIVPDGNPAPSFTSDGELYAHESTWPGYRLPHAWLERDNATLSTHDLCSRGQFTLLTGLRGAYWLAAAEAVSRRLGVAVRCQQIGLNLPTADRYGQWQRVSGIDEAGCLLVRPDMHVAWRSVHACADAGAALERVLRKILAVH